MKKQKQIMEKEKEDIAPTSKFGDYTESVFKHPLLDELLDGKDKKQVIIASVKFEQTSFGELAILELIDGTKYHTSSEVVMRKLKEVVNNNIPLPTKATILKKSSGNFDYYDIV